MRYLMETIILMLICALFFVGVMKTKTYIPYVVHKYRHSRHTDTHSNTHSLTYWLSKSNTAHHSTAQHTAENYNVK